MAFDISATCPTVLSECAARRGRLRTRGGAAETRPEALTPEGEEVPLRFICTALSREELQGEELSTSIRPDSGQPNDAAAREDPRWTLPAFLPSAPSVGAHL